jgi:hypothetical protein
MGNQSSVQQIRREHGILVTSVRLDQAATSPTLLHGVKSDEDIRRSWRHVLYCTVLYCTVLYCTALYCTVLYCTVLYCTVLYCTYCTVLYCTVLYCKLLNCTVLLLPIVNPIAANKYIISY